MNVDIESHGRFRIGELHAGGIGERQAVELTFKIVFCLFVIVGCAADLTNVIRFTDLPLAAQNKLLERKETRARLSNSLDLLGDDSGNETI